MPQFFISTAHRGKERRALAGIEFASVGAGLAIVGACSYAGYAEGPGFGILLGLVSLIVAAVVVSAVFIVTRTSADVRAIRKQVDQLQPPDADVKVHDQN